MNNKNYFEVGKPVTDDKFIGRLKELEQLDFFIKQNQSLVLIAPRRYGKTSLVKKFLVNLDSTYFRIQIDLMRYITTRDLANAIIEKCYENIKYKKAINDMQNGLLSFSKKLSSLVKINTGLLEIDGFEKFFINEDIDENEYLLYAFEFIEKISKANNQKAVIFIDEFGEIAKHNKDNSFLKQLRATIQHQTNTTYIFAGSQPTLMNHIFLDKNEPFFKFAIIMQIGKLNELNFISYCNNIFQENNIAIEKEILEDIYNFCGGVAYNLSLTMMILLMTNKSMINQDDIKDIKDKVLSIGSFGFENEIQLLKKKKNQFEVVLYLANNLNPYSIKNIKKQNINNILKSLEFEGIIRKEDNQYLLNDTLFKNYLILNLTI